MTEKPEKKPEGNTCQWCDKIIPDNWSLDVHETFATYRNEHNQFVHRHNFSAFKGNTAGGNKRKQPQDTTPTASERDLLREYFDTPKNIPASARILARKAAGGDLGSLKELQNRYGKDQAAQHTSPVQFEVSGGKKADHNDPRPILKIQKGLFADPDTWDEDTEDTQTDTPIKTSHGDNENKALQ